MKFTQNKRAQEEMIGFGLIIVIVMVVLLIVLGISINTDNREATQNYELESFLYASFEVTTTCENNFEPASLQELIFLCDEKRSCSTGENSCDQLNETMAQILSTSFPAGEERPIKGYEMNITSEGSPLYYAFEGNRTSNSKSSRQSFVRRGRSFEAAFSVYT